MYILYTSFLFLNISRILTLNPSLLLYIELLFQLSCYCPISYEFYLVLYIMLKISVECCFFFSNYIYSYHIGLFVGWLGFISKKPKTTKDNITILFKICLFHVFMRNMLLCSYDSSVTWVFPLLFHLFKKWLHSYNSIWYYWI